MALLLWTELRVGAMHMVEAHNILILVSYASDFPPIVVFLRPAFSVCRGKVTCLPEALYCCEEIKNILKAVQSAQPSSWSHYKLINGE